MPMNTEPFRSAAAKVQWAATKIEDLHHHVESYFASQPVNLSTRQGRKSVDVIANVTRPLPEDLPFLAGDWAHNLRSVLDHIVYSHVDDPAHQKTCVFPSWRPRRQPTREQWIKRVATSVPGARAEPLRTVFQCLQPYQGGTDEWLWALTELDNIDKHRVPLAVAAAVETTRAISRAQFLTESEASIANLTQGLLYEISMDPPPSHPLIKNPTAADFFTEARLEVVYSVPGAEFVTDGGTLYTFRRHEWHDIVEIEPSLTLVFAAPPREGIPVLDDMRTMTDNVRALLEQLRVAVAA